MSDNFDFDGGFDGGFGDDPIDDFGEVSEDVEEPFEDVEKSDVDEEKEPVEEAEDDDAEMSEGEKGEDGHKDMDGHHGKDDHGMMHDSPFEMMMKVETLMRWSAIDPFMGNLTYLLVAAGVTTHAALQAFRYTSKTGYYTAFLTGTGTNWFEIGDMIQNYANLSLFGIAFITQLLALFGILTWLNALVWFWGIMLVGGLVNGVAMFFKFLAYDNCWDKLNGCSTSVKADMVANTAMSTSVSLTLYMQAENWMWGVWEGQTQEEKDAQVEELLMEVAAWEEEMRAEMEAEMGEAETDGGKPEKEESAAEEESEKEPVEEETEVEQPVEEETEVEPEEPVKEPEEESDPDPFGDGGDDGFGDDFSFN